ncbi:MAG: signal peptidase II [Oscillospiraceae bacterium]|nr:signal peptidase II [Oscillospiraceae bacterium]
MWVWIVTAAAVIGFDQLTKLMVLKNISQYDTVRVIKGVIDFVNVKNTGAAFSMMNNATWFLAIVSAVFCAGLVIYLIKEKPRDRLYRTGLCLMFAGAFGNGLDRVFRGYVVDFIKTVFIDFPVFNIADISIVTGAVLCIIYLAFLNENNDEKNSEENGKNSA